MVNNSNNSNTSGDNHKTVADDDDFGEEVYTGKVKAATLPMGGPASRRKKKEIEGGTVAKGKASDTDNLHSMIS